MLIILATLQTGFHLFDFSCGLYHINGLIKSLKALQKTTHVKINFLRPRIGTSVRFVRSRGLPTNEVMFYTYIRTLKDIRMDQCPVSVRAFRYHFPSKNWRPAFNKWSGA